MKKVMFGLVGILLALFVVSSAMGQAVTYALDDIGGYAMPGGQNRSYTLTKLVDFELQNVTTNDVIQMFAIPSNTYVRMAAYKIVLSATNAVGTTPTFGLGDATATTQYLGAAASYPIGATTKCNHEAKWYGSDDTVDMKVSAPANKGQIRVWLECVDFNSIQ